MTQAAQSVAPRQDDPPYRPGEPVALFIPCYIDQFYPEIAQATAQLLKRYGVPLVYPDRADLLRPAGVQLGLLGRSPAGDPPFLRRLRAAPLDRLPLGLLHGDVPRVLRPCRPRPARSSASAAGCSS